jgi:hypothetical protein
MCYLQIIEISLKKNENIQLYKVFKSFQVIKITYRTYKTVHFQHKIIRHMILKKLLK